MITENLYTPDCIRTHSGQYVNVFNPDPDTILIEDIAHSLSQQCRFAGHLPGFYSVAQHSCRVSGILLPKHQLAGLLHDASEAYLLDIPSPIKTRIPQYKEIEDNLMRVIADKFGFQYPLHEDVKQADKITLQLEWDHIMLGGQGLFGWSMYHAKTAFLNKYEKLTK